MNLLPMHYFTIVVEKESINKAARELFITQQTLSAHMAALEKELGCVLFTRRPRFKLTYAGQKFYQYALTFERTYSAMLEEFSELRERESGVLRVGVAHTRGMVLLPEVIGKFTMRYPYVQIRLQEMKNHMLLDSLSEGGIDLAIGDIPQDRPEFAACDLYQEELLLLVHKNLYAQAAIDDAQIAKLPFLMGVEDDIAGRIGKQFLKSRNIVPRVITVSENVGTLLFMCRKGLGAVFCPDRLLYGLTAPAERAELQIIPLGQCYFIRAAWLNERYVSGSLQHFLAVLQNLPERV